MNKQIIILVTVIFYISCNDDVKLVDKIEKANSHLEKDEYNKALDIFNIILLDDSNNYAATQGKIITLNLIGDFKNSLILGLKNKFEFDARINYEIATSYIGLNLKDSALKYAINSYNIDAKDYAWARVCNLSISLGSDSIYKHYLIKGTKYEESYDYNLLQARFYFNKNIIDSSLYYTNLAIVKCDSCYESYMIKGKLLESKDDLKNSIDNYSIAYQLNPNDEDLLKLYIISLFKIGDEEKICNLIKNNEVKNDSLIKLI